MKCKKQMIQTSLLAFGLSMGVGLTGSPSALAAPIINHEDKHKDFIINDYKIKCENSMINKEEKIYEKNYNEWILANLNFLKEVYSELNDFDICYLMLDKKLINMDTANNIAEKAGKISKLDQEIVRNFKDAKDKMIKARNQFIEKSKNTIELKDYVKELNFEINELEKSINNKITWTINPNIEHAKITEELILQEKKEMKKLLEQNE